MARHDDEHPDTAAPEADQLEQEQAADPRTGQPEEWPAHTAADVDEADQLEQVREVVGDPDEDYEPDSP